MSIAIFLALAILSGYSAAEPCNSCEPPQPANKLDLASCVCNVKELGLSVDIIVDLGCPWRPTPVGCTCPPAAKRVKNNPPYRPASLVNVEIAEFVDAISQSIPKTHLNAIILNGNVGNRTRYYLSMANVANLPSIETKADIPPHYPHYPFFVPYHYLPRTLLVSPSSATSIGALLRMYLDARSLSALPQLPTSKPSDCTASSTFTVVITDGGQGTSVTSYPKPNIIIDINGNFAANTKGKTNANILIAPADSISLLEFTRTVRYQICQAAGGL